MKMPRPIYPLARWVLTGVLVAATAVSASAQASLLDQVQSRGRVRVAVTTGSPPFAFINEAGEFDGFDIDIAKLIAKSIFGTEEAIEFVRTSFEGRWATVNTGRADFGIMVTTIYPERALRVAFTEGYVDSGNSCMVRKDSGITSYEGLNDPNVSIAFLNIPKDLERHERFYPRAKALIFESQADQYAAVLSGQATAACSDLPNLQWVAREHPDTVEVLGGDCAGAGHGAQDHAVR